MVATSPLITFEHVYVQRGQRLALNDLNLHVKKGEHVAILGPNGSGKSTLIKTITRECYPLLQAETFLQILGRDRWDIFELRTEVGLVSNDLAAQCHRDITGRELVLSGFFGSIGTQGYQTVLPEMRDVAAQAMRRLQVEHLADRWLDELSSGEARRLLIARSLIHHPHTLLLDEPTTSLDLVALREVRSQMQVLAQSGVGLVLVTHHLDDIIPEIDRVVLLRDGSVYADGPKNEMLQARLLSDVYRIPVNIGQQGGFYHAW